MPTQSSALVLERLPNGEMAWLKPEQPEQPEQPEWPHWFAPIAGTARALRPVGHKFGQDRQP